MEKEIKQDNSMGQKWNLKHKRKTESLSLIFKIFKFMSRYQWEDLAPFIEVITKVWKS
jgi:hypothetical protein